MSESKSATDYPRGKTYSSSHYNIYGTGILPAAQELTGRTQNSLLGEYTLSQLIDKES